MVRRARLAITSCVLVAAGLAVLAPKPAVGADVTSPAPRASHGPRSASEIVGHRVAASSGATVTTLVNVAVIRAHPVGARLGPVFAATPGWREVLAALPSGPAQDGGAPTPPDPLRAVDWAVFYGPSLVKDAGHVVLARSALSDPTIDATFAAVSRGSTRGGAFDTGVPGVVAVRANPDRTERVLMRVQPGIVIVAPPDKAAELARTEQHATFPMRVRPGEAIRTIIREPSRNLMSGRGTFPANMSELRAWMDLHGDGSADIWAEGDCDTRDHAEDARTFFASAITQNNGLVVRMATHGLLDNATTVTVGNMMSVHIPATRDQVEALVSLAEANFGVPARP